MSDEVNLGESAELFLTKIAATDNDVLVIDPNKDMNSACAVLVGLDLEKAGLVSHERVGNIAYFRFTPKGWAYFHGEPARLN